jgi:23S rRNA (cytidine1920-2'-O)/16S rRNA (cytidine1409-2'-O)-methyltransferase
MKRERIDRLLVERGLAPSRTRAQALVMAGLVLVGEQRVEKSSETFERDAQVRVRGADDPASRYVGRGGLKLEAALDAFRIDVTGFVCLDVGASTGGFTDCLLQRGAREVIAVDVGYGILDYRLRSDPRVAVLERTNARELTPAMLPAAKTPPDRPPELAVIDVSFISLTKVLGAVTGCLAGDWDVLAMIKPQFEVGRGRVGKGGVVRESADRRSALIEVGRAARSLGASVLGYHSSGLPGPKGNLETFIRLAAPGRPAGARDDAELEQLARQVEP